MINDLQVLTLSAILAWLMLLTGSYLRNRGWTPQGRRVALGNRDDVPEPTPLAGRADRAARNMLENLVLFTALLAAVHFAGEAGARSELGANLFFWGRVAYWPIYLAGIVYARTVAWAVSIVGLAMLASAMW
jgi:uncharacterized MAPEG superfamily protein